MAGACGKLKCCLLYELDVYIEARKEFPKELLYLETAGGTAKPVNTDYLKKEIWFSLENDSPSGTFKLTLKEFKDIIQKNKRGIQPELQVPVNEKETGTDWEPLNTGRIDRFEKKRKNKRRKKKNNRKKTGRKQQ